MSADRPGGFGAALRNARERKGVSLREIANRTKISVAALESLERNDISRLPGGIFSRAFVRSYANEVGLDPEATIQDFIAQFPQEAVTAGHTKSDPVEDTVLFESERRAASSVLWLLLVSIPLAGGVLYLSVSRRGEAEEASAAVVRSEPAPVQTAGTQPVVPAASAPVESAPTPPDVVPAAAPPAVAAASTPADPAPPAAASTDSDLLTIALQARRPVWISATVDGQKAIGRLLQPGEQETIEVRREMVITAGDASAVRMTLNGSEARALGKTGEVVTARLSLSNFKEYLQSR
jgi:cytoskeleton protein RodZ